MNILTALDEEIAARLLEMSIMDVKSDEYRIVDDNVCKLIDRRLEMEKLDIESQEKVDAREAEKELRLKQMEEDRKDRRWKNGIAIAGVVTSTGLAIWGTITCLNFEKDCTWSTIIGKAWSGRMLPRK